MNVLHVLDRSVPNLSGYSSRSRYIVENQADLGLNPMVITCERQESDKEIEFISDIKYFRTFQNRYKNFKKIPVLREWIEIQNLKNRISGVLDNNKIDLIHVHSPCIWGIAALGAARKHEIPIVYEIRAFWEDAATDAKKYNDKSLKYKVVRRLETRLANKVDHLFCLTSAIKDEMITRGVFEEKITVVPNGVDLNKFNPVIENKNIKEKYNLNKSFIIGFIGSFFDFEGLDILIKAAIKLKNEKLDLKLLLVGGGEKELYLRKLVKEKGCDSFIIFTRSVPHAQVAGFYSVMDVLVYPRKSRRITELVTPLKPLEAMAMNKCVVLSDVGGHKELVNDEDSAIFFKKDNVDDLVLKIKDMMSNSSKIETIKSNAAAYVKKNKSWNKIVRSYLPVYQRVTSSSVHK